MTNLHAMLRITIKVLQYASLTKHVRHKNNTILSPQKQYNSRRMWPGQTLSFPSPTIIPVVSPAVGSFTRQILAPVLWWYQIPVLGMQTVARRVLARISGRLVSREIFRECFHLSWNNSSPLESVVCLLINCFARVWGFCAKLVFQITLINRMLVERFGKVVWLSEIMELSVLNCF